MEAAAARRAEQVDRAEAVARRAEEKRARRARRFFFREARRPRRRRLERDLAAAADREQLAAVEQEARERVAAMRDALEREQDARELRDDVASGVEIRIRSTWSIWDEFGERDRSQTSRDLGSREAHSVARNEPKRPRFERARAL